MPVSFQHTPLMSLFYLNYCLSFSKTPEILSRDTTCLMLRLRAGNWPLTTARPDTQRRSPVPLAFARRVACNARRRGTVARVGGWVWSLCLGWGGVFVCLLFRGVFWCFEGDWFVLWRVWHSSGLRVRCLFAAWKSNATRTMIFRKGRSSSRRTSWHKRRKHPLVTWQYIIEPTNHESRSSEINQSLALCARWRPITGFMCPDPPGQQPRALGRYDNTGLWPRLTSGHATDLHCYLNLRLPRVLTASASCDPSARQDAKDRSFGWKAPEDFLPSKSNGVILMLCFTYIYNTEHARGLFTRHTQRSRGTGKCYANSHFQSHNNNLSLLAL